MKFFFILKRTYKSFCNLEIRITNNEMKDLENILCPKIVGSGIMLTNNRKKDIKIISSLENG